MTETVAQAEAIGTQAIADAMYLPLDLLIPSPTNPRKRFSEESLAELADTIEQHGVLQPLLARPNPAHTPGDGRSPYEIVAGERRWRSSKLLREQGKSYPHAGLVPVIVRDLDDGEVLGLQLVENVGRVDLHPLEEADHYHLMTTHHSGAITVKELALKIGKTVNYVYNRLSLRKLVPQARDAFFAGKLDYSKALQIAVMPADQQPQILEHVTTWGGEPLGARASAKHIHDHYTLQLAGAPFNVHDAQLLEAAGACTECPKRSDRVPQLFADVSEGDRCLDSACFGQKRAAHREWQLANARAEGYIVLEHERAATVMNSKSATLLSGWHDLKGTVPAHMGDPKQSVEEVVDRAHIEASAITVVPHPAQDILVYAVPTLTLDHALRKAGAHADQRKSAKEAPSAGQATLDAIDPPPPPPAKSAKGKAPAKAPAPAPAPAYDPLDDVLKFDVLPKAVARVEDGKALATFQDRACARLAGGLVAHKVAGEIADRGESLRLILPRGIGQLLLVSLLTTDYHFELVEVAKLALVDELPPKAHNKRCAWALERTSTEATAMVLALLCLQRDGDKDVAPGTWRDRVARELGVAPEPVFAKARGIVDERLRLELLARGPASGGKGGGGKAAAKKKPAAKKVATKVAAKKAAPAKKAQAPATAKKKISAGAAGGGGKGAKRFAPLKWPGEAETKMTDEAASPRAAAKKAPATATVSDAGAWPFPGDKKGGAQ